VENAYTVIVRRSKEKWNEWSHYSQPRPPRLSANCRG
jgi:hypothetical protein